MQDGLVDRYFNRKLSSRLTPWLVKTPLTPNQITLISVGVGLVSAFFFWLGEYLYGVLGALLFQFSAVLDCCDGEVARLKSMQSRFGWWLDLIGDNVVHIALFLAIAWAVYRQSGSGLWLGLGAAASAGASLSLGFVLLQETVSSRAAQADDPLRRAMDQAVNRDFSLVVLVFALIHRLDWFLWLAALGANLFWMVLGWLYWRRSGAAL